MFYELLYQDSTPTEFCIVYQGTVYDTYILYELILALHKLASYQANL